MTTGEAVVADELHPFDEVDNQVAVEMLRKLYDADTLEMPGRAPAFNPDAALWACQHIYRVIQFLLLRNLGADLMEANLPDFAGVKTADAIYSADIMLRYLPVISGLAKRLAPDDPLVMRLKQTAEQWPFSSVGCDMGTLETNTAIILADPSLSIAYADRIIEQREQKRITNDGEEMLISSVLGNFQQILWPGLKAGLQI